MATTISGIAKRVGWDDDGDFSATIVFKSPPDWPFDVVWKKWPIELTTSKPEIEFVPIRSSSRADNAPGAGSSSPGSGESDSDIDREAQEHVEGRTG